MTGNSLFNKFNRLHHGIGDIPETMNENLANISKPHIESFNYAMKEGLQTAVANMEPVYFTTHNNDRVKLWIASVHVARPEIKTAVIYRKVYPSECRQRGTTYSGHLLGEVRFTINEGTVNSVRRSLGEIPIMLKSSFCYLEKMSPKQLIEVKEDIDDPGGYFLVNGGDKVVRMLVAPRRNYPIAITRDSWKSHNPLFTEFGVQIRCVADDERASTLTLHYCKDASVIVSFIHTREQFFMPLMMMMKGLVDLSDYEIFSKVITGNEGNGFFRSCVVNMVRNLQKENLLTQEDVLIHIGSKFRVKLQLPDYISNEEVGKFLLRQTVCIHLKKNADKLELLAMMTRKLFALAKEECAIENPDSPMNHEVLSPGILYLNVLVDRMYSFLQGIKPFVERKIRSQTSAMTSTELGSVIRTAIGNVNDVGKAITYFLATGNISAKSKLAIQQTSGLAVVLEKINYFRYISHFRAIHRGAFFTKMRTTSARKLLPEAWGFICPVNTPDGSSCGILNHITKNCFLSPRVNPSDLRSFLLSHGVKAMYLEGSKDIEVLLDGTVVGWLAQDDAPYLVNRLRALKVSPDSVVPECTEITFAERTVSGCLYPGLFIFTGSARLMRPVFNEIEGKVEMIGSFEQVFLNVAIDRKTQEKWRDDAFTHSEINKSNFLSELASFTPFSENNQSPRNIYQCQMGKQTMGWPGDNLKYRVDNKMYTIHTPQTPLLRTQSFCEYAMDHQPMGTTAIVAIISYTGYDMEDAMVINKASVERGFAYGFITKTQRIHLQDQKSSLELIKVFGFKQDQHPLVKHLDADGLPEIGAVIEPGGILYSYVIQRTGQCRLEKYTGMETIIISEVRMLANPASPKRSPQEATIQFHIQRTPIVGDKFASRHGQKGVCSLLYPQHDAPFTERGLVPDIFFNPHGFPSRMTIGMMIEVMAGKYSAHSGNFTDGTPFQYTDEENAIDYFGKKLIECGYNYYGTERMLSGISGEELEADIFFGPIYYQRLRHMISDKFQVRTTGTVDKLTQQPIKGRKRGGGIRVGEMERDALLAHGVSFVVLDRLLECSDKWVGEMCSRCGSLVSTTLLKPPSTCLELAPRQKWMCRQCNKDDRIVVIRIPYVLKLLVTEFAAMNVRVKFDVENKAFKDIMGISTNK